MNQKELNEIRRRFKLDKNAISRIYGCYVNSNKEIIANIDASMGLMSQEEQEMYLGLLKKSLSGALGRNLIDIEFSTAQVTDSDEHRLLQTVRQTALQDRNSREALCRRIIDAMDMGETNYLILLAADTYDVPCRGRDDETFADGSDTVYKYFVCSICPVKAPTLELKYSNEDSEFHSASTGHIALAPELGFLFPAFDDRAANIYNALFYSKNAAELHQEVIDAVFRVAEPPMSAEEQKNVFSTALGDALQKDCSYDVVQSVVMPLGKNIASLADLKDKKVGGQIGTTGIFVMEKSKAGATIREYDDVGLAMKDLANGRLDAVICDSNVATYYANVKAEYKNHFHVAFKTKDVEHLGFCLNKDDTKMQKLLNDGLAKMRANGKLQEITKKWMGE